MFPPTRQQALVIVVCALAVIALIGATYHGNQGTSASMSPVSANRGGVVSAQLNSGAGAPSSTTIVVDVDGAVRHAGVYRLPAGSRVTDALKMAGGTTTRAAVVNVNRAAPLVDGQQIIVPALGSQVVAVSGATASQPAAKVSLNTASADDFEQLSGVGPVTAQKIVQYRQQHGSFKSIDALEDVPGIGPATVAALGDQLTL